MTARRRAVLWLGAALLLAIAAGWWLARPTPRAAQSAFSVALILPGPHDDHGWSQAGHEGMQLIAKQLGARATYRDNVTPEIAERHFRRFAREGYTFVIGHGGEYVVAAEKVAAEFPRTRFAVVTRYAGNNRNLGALSFRDGEVGYLTGLIAALKSRTKRIAYIGGVPYSHMRDQSLLFAKGAKAHDPAVQVAIRWAHTWTDPEKVRKLAVAEIRRGADVLLVNADLASPGGFEEAERAGIRTIGWSKDQYHLSPRTMLTSGIQRVPILLLNGAILVQKGRWEGKQYKFGLQEGAQGLAPFRGALTPEQEGVVRAAQEGIVLGRISVTP